MSFRLSHPSMGEVAGKKTDGVVQFLGIEYATLLNRLAPSHLKKYSSSDVVTATALGPTVLISPMALSLEMNFIQQSLPGSVMPPASEVHGLNLNITLPSSAIGSNKQLPVLVYIHGGGFAFGSSAYPHYDQAEIVRLAANRGEPIIAVNLNYRVGLPGFLTSKELREAGYLPNNGLRDQQTALRWIKEYISGFGGNPAAVTVMGQSAGAASTTLHLLSKEGLFDQAILLAGTFLMMQPMSYETTEQTYQEVIRDFGLEKLSAQERINALLNLPAETLIEKVSPSLLLGSVMDGEIITFIPTFENLAGAQIDLIPGRKWCRRLLTTDSQLDASIFALINLNAREQGICSAFLLSIGSSLSSADPAALNKLLEAYSLSSDTPDPEALLSITQFFTDVMFYAPSLAVAALWPKSYVCHFNEGNPWDGRYKDRSNHMLDIAYLFQNLNGKLAHAQQAVAEAFATDIGSFTAHVDMMPVFGTSREVVTYGPSAKGLVRNITKSGSKDAGRIENFLALAEAVGGLDSLLQACGRFLGGR